MMNKLQLDFIGEKLNEMILREKIEQLSKKLIVALEEHPKIDHLVEDFINDVVNVCGQQTKTILIKYNDELMNYLQENYQVK